MAITAALAKTCYSWAGGVERLYLCDKASVTSMTLTSEQYSAITMASSNVFYEYEFEDGTCKADYEVDGSDGKSTSVKAMIEFYIEGLSNTNRTAIASLMASSPCGIIAIVVDTTGTKWVYGYGERSKKAMKMTKATGSTGAKVDEQQGQTVTLENLTPEIPRVYTGTVPV